MQSLESLERLQSLEIYCGNYNDVVIPEGAIIYCDPPYKGTAEYSEGGFNHEDFWEWVRMISKTHKIYISEYQAPEDFVPLINFHQKSSLQGGSQTHNNQPSENVFAHKSMFENSKYPTTINFKRKGFNESNQSKIDFA